MSDNMRPVIASGLLLATGTGLASLAFGYPFLTSAFAHLHWPVVGDLELASAMAFDLGVNLVVVGTKEKDYDPGVDWPHPRYVCVRHPYSKENGTLRYMACNQCYCHICGCVWRSCPTWGTHCAARDCAMDNDAKSKM